MTIQMIPMKLKMPTRVRIHLSAGCQVKQVAWLRASVKVYTSWTRSMMRGFGKTVGISLGSHVWSTAKL